MPDLAADLVRLQVDLIVSVATQAALAAKNATKAIPIVMLNVANPIGSGLVPSLARPGGNMTARRARTWKLRASRSRCYSALFRN